MILGVDVGGTNIDIVSYDGEFRHVATYPTKDTIGRLGEVVNEIVNELGVEVVGIGLAAWIKRGRVIKMPNIRGELSIELEVPYVLDNDANCFTYYSARFFELKNVFGVTVGTGVGGGIVADGRLVHGEGLAGEIGHWFVGGDEECTCGGKGHLEAYFGGWSFRKRFGRDAKEMVEDGSVYRIDGFEKFCVALANAITLLDPEAVVLGGRIGGNLNVGVVKERVYEFLMDGFEPEILTLNDPLAVAKGACLIAEELKRP